MEEQPLSTFGESVIYEQIVARRPREKEAVLKAVLILLVLAVAVFGWLIVGFIFVLIAVLLAFLFYYFVFPRQKVEYEYSLLQSQLKFSIIYNKAKRKKKLEVDLAKAESILPRRDGQEVGEKAQKTYDYTSGDPDAPVYVIQMQLEGDRIRIYFEPDEEMRRRIRRDVRGSYYGSIQV